MAINNFLTYGVSYLRNLDIASKIQYVCGNYVTQQATLCNKLLSTCKPPTSYLEIGVDEGRTFQKIKSDIKHGVDPYGTYEATYRMTSEMFFALNKRFMHHTYDVVLIDASHFSLIVDREIEESFNILNSGGYIVLHDTDPLTRKAQEVVLEDQIAYLRRLSYPHNRSHTDSLSVKTYNGDVWKSVAKIRMTNPTIDVFTVKHFCCTVLFKGKRKKLMNRVSDAKLHWTFFVKNRKKILHPVDFSRIDRYLR